MKLGERTDGHARALLAPRGPRRTGFAAGVALRAPRGVVTFVARAGREREREAEGYRESEGVNPISHVV